MKQLLKQILVKVTGHRRMRNLAALMRTLVVHNQRPAVWHPEGGRIVVLAPHMDDEVLGCGGTIARHVLAGAEVSVIFLTDGRHGGRASAGLSKAEREQKQSDLVQVRKLEARLAGDVLGVKNIAFLDAEDGRLRGNSLVPSRLRAILESEQPHVVYLPFLLERHIDHRAAGEMLVAATAGQRHDFECRCYEVWTPLLPNIVVEIDDVIELKKRALGCYPSQLEGMDYLHSGIGLNAYRSSAVGGNTVRFVEAFFALPLADYERFHRRVSRFL